MTIYADAAAILVDDTADVTNDAVLAARVDTRGCLVVSIPHNAELVAELNDTTPAGTNRFVVNLVELDTNEVTKAGTVHSRSELTGRFVAGALAKLARKLA